MLTPVFFFISRVVFSVHTVMKLLPRTSNTHQWEMPVQLCHFVARKVRKIREDNRDYFLRCHLKSCPPVLQPPLCASVRKGRPQRTFRAKSSQKQGQVCDAMRLLIKITETSITGMFYFHPKGFHVKKK